MAISLYEAAHGLESELPHYQLNLAAAHLKLNKYVIPYLLAARILAYANPKAGWKLRKPVCAETASKRQRFISARKSAKNAG